jgi:hypothetical protein
MKGERKMLDNNKKLGTIPADIVEDNRSLFSFIIYHIA